MTTIIIIVPAIVDLAEEIKDLMTIQTIVDLTDRISYLLIWRFLVVIKWFMEVLFFYFSYFDKAINVKEIACNQ